jgi:hypothetical protein
VQHFQVNFGPCRQSHFRRVAPQFLITNIAVQYFPQALNANTELIRPMVGITLFAMVAEFLKSTKNISIEILGFWVKHF